MFKVFTVFILILLSCGSEPEAQKIQEAITPVEEFPDILKKLRSEMKQIKLSCASRSGTCPAQMVLLGSVDSITGNSKYCNAISLGGGRVVTASKCIPSNLVRGSELCEESLLLKTQESPGRVYRCKSVKSLDIDRARLRDFPESWISDYVLLEFSSLDIKSSPKFSIKMGISQGEHTLWGYVFSEDKKSALLREHKCSVSFYNYIQPLGQHRYSSNLSLVNCEKENYFESHNALGSALIDKLDSQYHYLGMFFSPLTTNLKREIADLGMTLSKSSFSLGNGFVENFSCWIELYENSSQRPSECFLGIDVGRHEQISFERNEMLNLEMSQEVKFKKITDFYQRKYEEADFFIRWQTVIDSNNLNYTISSKPLCFQNTKDWLRKIKKKKHTYEQVMDKSYLSPSFDDQMRVQIKESKGVKLFRIKFFVKNLKRKSRSDLIVQELDSVTESVMKEYTLTNIPICEN